MNNETKYKYINNLPKEYHRVIWDIMIKAESNKFVNECEKLTKKDCKLIMKYLYKITTENKRLINILNEIKNMCKEEYYERNTTDIDSIGLSNNIWVMIYMKIKELIGDSDE